MKTIRWLLLTDSPLRSKYRRRPEEAQAQLLQTKNQPDIISIKQAVPENIYKRLINLKVTRIVIRLTNNNSRLLLELLKSSQKMLHSPRSLTTREDRLGKTCLSAAALRKKSRMCLSVIKLKLIKTHRIYPRNHPLSAKECTTATPQTCLYKYPQLRP